MRKYFVHQYSPQYGSHEEIYISSEGAKKAFHSIRADLQVNQQVRWGLAEGRDRKTYEECTYTRYESPATYKANTAV